MVFKVLRRTRMNQRELNFAILVENFSEIGK